MAARMAGPAELRNNDSMLITEIDHLQLAAPKGCEAAARLFFGQLLGLQELEKPESLHTRGGCWFRVGSRQLHIGVEEPFCPANKAHPAFAISNVVKLYALLEEHGVRCVWDEAIGDVRRFCASVPWGESTGIHGAHVPLNGKQRDPIVP